MRDREQSDAADQDENDAASVVSAQKVESGKTAGGQSDNREENARKTPNKKTFFILSIFICI